MKYLRVNHFWIDDITFAHTCVIGARHFLDNRFGGDFDFGCYDTLRYARTQDEKPYIYGTERYRMRDRNVRESIWSVPSIDLHPLRPVDP